MRKREVVRPVVCPVCGKPYRINWLGRCIYCGSYLGHIKY